MRRPTGRFNPTEVGKNSFVEIDHEIFSMVILSLPLIQEGQLSVSGKNVHNTELSLPSKHVAR